MTVILRRTWGGTPIEHEKGDEMIRPEGWGGGQTVVGEADCHGREMVRMIRGVGGSTGLCELDGGQRTKLFRATVGWH